ncbi:MAG: DUF2249 domain-containing protein [Betaproteobacteria bacterium]|nr:DUF2249 domain-containing protein [Betaproteobacteria bacterium]
MADERLIDVRGLEPPEPMLKVLHELDSLPAGQVLHMIHHREPFPLYTALEESGFHYRTETGAPGRVDILIWR